MNLARATRLFGALLLLSSCQQQVAGASDPVSGVREACLSGDKLACRQLAEAAQRSARPVPPADESHAARVQRDVAAIIRGMRQTSASNGL